ncbi:hypothetical protein GIB67_000322 [Kingdonia uniflora]|uniref:Protein kinase domain-containing protein n=1 Tax=Kingdonia uniflora TaxID=39325 RepID=A0A7J7LCL8_9MAGN|nr:hypothetical protein GIB67_000322 [Kingdonia uniflora]
MAGQLVVQAISTAAGNNGYGTAEVKIAMALNTGCYIRYSTKKFYNDEVARSGEVMRKVIAVVLLVSSFSLLAMLGAFMGYTGPSKTRCNNFIHFSFAVINSELNFKYETLEKAIDCFSPLKTLSQGGAGSVYKGTLFDGRTVVVKRLFFNTRKWVDDFFNEVNLIGDNQHKNLVKLLGCSLEGLESLLVHEYVLNSSLDQIIFSNSFDDPNCYFF